MKGPEYGQLNQFFFHICVLVAEQVKRWLKTSKKLWVGADDAVALQNANPCEKTTMPAQYVYLGYDWVKTQRQSKAERVRDKLPKSQVYRKGDRLGTIRVVLMYDTNNKRS